MTVSKNNGVVVEIFYDDLTPEAQLALDEAIGDHNYDVFPICTIYTEE